MPEKPDTNEAESSRERTTEGDRRPPDCSRVEHHLRWLDSVRSSWGDEIRAEIARLAGERDEARELLRTGEQIAVLTTQRDEAARLAGELLAVIRVNHAHGQFAKATMAQVEECLKPFDARLRAIHPPFRPDQFRDATKMIPPTNDHCPSVGAPEKP